MTLDDLISPRRAILGGNDIKMACFRWKGIAWIFGEDRNFLRFLAFRLF